jgi:GT2 family glycosyltransferase/uncharacterized membrane-anchored protein YhcB (DUF1043 family)
VNTSKKVDIIIPIYNAYEYTKQCIQSIINNTKLNKNTLILINDKSTDSKMADMLEEFVKNNKDKNIKLVNNKENLGFVKTVNLGMKMSNNDVVLLNSDTEVTENWLVKLQNTAYVAENVATVTPLSNNATLASIPNFLEDNEIPNYIKVEDYAKYIEEHSYNFNPELTTAHGFCMYIRRNAIEKVGYFDEDLFEKGYGEENDFSYRCINNGLVNLLCDNTFIYHKGTQSFSAEKEEFINSHIKILQDKYPANYAMNTDLCVNNPYSYVQDNIKYNLENEYRKNILIIIHEFRKKESKLLGGTAEHVYDIINTLRDKMNFHVMYFDDGVYKLKSFFENSEAELYLGSVVSYNNSKMYNVEYKNLIKKVLKIVNVNLVHVHHMINHYFDLFDVINEAKIPYIINLHDYYFACPNFSLVENNEKCCVGNVNRNCDNCLKNLKNLEGNFARNWRSMTSKVLSRAKRVIVPSNSAKEVYSEFFPSLKIDVVEHGVDKSRYNIKEIEKVETERKNIAFIGGINKIKGCDFLRKFIEKSSNEQYRYNVHLFGTAIEEDLNEAKGNYIFHGTYDRENIVNELKENSIDLVLLLTIWPESYSYTLTESALAEIPVLAIDYGAVSERVQKNKLGYIVPKNATFEDIENEIDSIFAEPENYKETVKNINKYAQTLKTVKTMAREYEKTYEKFMVDNVFEKLSREEFEQVLKYSKALEFKDNRIQNDANRIKEYHYMVNAYKAEIQRLDSIINERDATIREQKARIEAYEIMEKKYNHLIESRKLQMLDKIGFIDMDL